jgi:pyruvate kinase
VANAALDLKAKAILTATESGYTARMVSKYRPQCPIIASTPNEQVLRRMALTWGVIPIYSEKGATTDQMFEFTVETAVNANLLGLGDLVIITAGVPVGRSGTTNLMKIHHIGEVLASGQGIGTQNATGKVVVATTAEDAIARVDENTVLVTVSTDKDYIPAFKKAAAVITVNGGITSHAAVVGLSLGIPVIVGVEKATEVLQDGAEVSVYAEIGVIYSGRAKVL